VGWEAAAQIAASQHFNSAWTPRAGSVASVSRTRNTSHHPDHIHTKGAIRIKRQHGYGRRISSSSWRYSRRTAANTYAARQIQKANSQSITLSAVASTMAGAILIWVNLFSCDLGESGVALWRTMMTTLKTVTIAAVLLVGGASVVAGSVSQS
jgi:hypothetical protein